MPSSIYAVNHFVNITPLWWIPKGFSLLVLVQIHHGKSLNVSQSSLSKINSSPPTSDHFLLPNKDFTTQTTQTTQQERHSPSSHTPVPRPLLNIDRYAVKLREAWLIAHLHRVLSIKNLYHFRLGDEIRSLHLPGWKFDSLGLGHRG